MDVSGRSWHHDMAQSCSLLLPQKMLKAQGVRLARWLPKSHGASLLVWAWRDKAVCPLVPPSDQGLLLPAVTPHV